MRSTGIVLDPLDTLFFRDGRPFGDGGRGRSGIPTPQTLAGAIRTHALRLAGFDFARLHGVEAASATQRLRAAGAPEWASLLALRGPLLGLLGRSGEVEPLFPAPANLAWTDDARTQLLRLDPLADPPPGWRDPGGILPLWCRRPEVGKSATGYITRPGADRWLSGGVPEKSELIDADTLYGFEERTGLAISPETSTGEDGRLYSVRLLRLTEQAGDGRRVIFYAQVWWPDDGPEATRLFAPGTTIPWGGEGRRVAVRTMPPISFPSFPAAEGRAVRWLLTPAIFRAGSRPDGDRGLVSAAVPVAIGVSGWDLVRRAPKPNRFAVPAGSVYFYEMQHPNAIAPLLADADLVAEGWAVTLQGAWNHA